MNEQYVIFGDTLDRTAEAIRGQTHITEGINPLDFPQLIAGIDLSTEEYMRISDLLEHPIPPNEAWYTEEEIAKVDTLMEFYNEMEDDINGE